MTYPVQVDVESPPQFERIQLLLRLAIAVGLGWLGITAGWLTWLLYLALPVFAAIIVSTNGAARYTDDVGPRLWRGLTWLLAFSAYMLLLTDRFPVTGSQGLRIELQRTGRPTTSSTLMRLVTSIPSALVLSFIGIVSCVLFVVGAVSIVLGVEMPGSVLAFQRGVLRWQTRLLAYHASLVDEYPPFSFDESPTQPNDRATML
jgi:hypothetical protein